MFGQNCCEGSPVNFRNLPDRTDVLHRGRAIATVCQIQLQGQWWWAAMTPGREMLSARARESRREALQDAVGCVQADGTVRPQQRIAEDAG